MTRYPEVAAEGHPRRMNGQAVTLRGSLRSHLRVTESRFSRVSAGRRKRYIERNEFGGTP